MTNEKTMRTREEQYKDPRFVRNLSGEVHIASGISIFSYAEEYATGLPSSSSQHDHSFSTHWSTPNWYRPVTRLVTVEDMEKSVKEAEERGATEARAEDAKGQEPFGYLLEDDANHLKHPDGLEQFGEYCDQKCEGFQVAIYTRPANVAELEARVAHLEAALLKIRDSDTFCGSQQLRHIAAKVLKK